MSLRTDITCEQASLSFSFCCCCCCCCCWCCFFFFERQKDETDVGREGMSPWWFTDTENVSFKVLFTWKGGTKNTATARNYL